MKIVQFMASEKWGGAEKVFVELSNKLAESNTVFAIVLRDTEYNERFSTAVTIIELRSNPTSRNPFLHFELRSTIKRLRPDIIHTHASKATELVHLSMIFTGLHHLATKHNARKGRIFNRVRYVSTVSEEARKSVKTRSNGKVWMVSNGIEPKEPAITTMQERDTLFTIVAIGRLDTIKGFDLLIEQISHVQGDCCLKIYGTGKEHSNLKNLIVRYGLEDKVSLEGFSDSIPEIMARSDLVVISSHSEGFPYVLVEALFYANVLIATPVGGLQEVLPDLYLCNNAEMGAKIDEIISNYRVYKDGFTQLKKQKAHQFTLQNTVDNYEMIYGYLAAT